MDYNSSNEALDNNILSSNTTTYNESPRKSINKNNTRSVDLRLGSGQSIQTIEKINQSLIRVSSFSSKSAENKNKESLYSNNFSNFRRPSHSTSTFYLLSTKEKNKKGMKIMANSFLTLLSFINNTVIEIFQNL